MIRVDVDTMAAILRGEPVQVEHRTTQGHFRGESYPVALYDPTDVRVVVTHSQIKPSTRTSKLIKEPVKKKPGRRRPVTYVLSCVLDRSAPPTLLSAESGGGVITPLGEAHSADEPEAHGYTDDEARSLDAGEAPESSEIATYAESQHAAQRYAAERVDELSKRRARALANRVRDALMQARARGVDPSEAIEAIEQQLQVLQDAVKQAA